MYTGAPTSALIHNYKHLPVDGPQRLVSLFTYNMYKCILFLREFDLLKTSVGAPIYLSLYSFTGIPNRRFHYLIHMPFIGDSIYQKRRLALPRHMINQFPNECQSFVNSENDGWGSRASDIHVIHPLFIMTKIVRTITTIRIQIKRTIDMVSWLYASTI